MLQASESLYDRSYCYAKNDFFSRYEDESEIVPADPATPQNPFATLGDFMNTFYTKRMMAPTFDSQLTKSCLLIPVLEEEDDENEDGGSTYSCRMLVKEEPQTFSLSLPSFDPPSSPSQRFPTTPTIFNPVSQSWTSESITTHTPIRSSLSIINERPGYPSSSLSSSFALASPIAPFTALSDPFIPTLPASRRKNNIFTAPEESIYVDPEDEIYGTLRSPRSNEDFSTFNFRTKDKYHMLPPVVSMNPRSTNNQNNVRRPSNLLHPNSMNAESWTNDMVKYEKYTSPNLTVHHSQHPTTNRKKRKQSGVVEILRKRARKNKTKKSHKSKQLLYKGITTRRNGYKGRVMISKQPIEVHGDDQHKVAATVRKMVTNALFAGEYVRTVECGYAFIECGICGQRRTEISIETHALKHQKSFRKVTNVYLIKSKELFRVKMHGEHWGYFKCPEFTKHISVVIKNICMNHQFLKNTAYKPANYNELANETLIRLLEKAGIQLPTFDRRTALRALVPYGIRI